MLHNHVRKGSSPRSEKRQPIVEKPASEKLDLLNLQRLIGNRQVQRLLNQPNADAVQRSISITNYNTTAGGQQQNQALNIAQVRAAITNTVSNANHRATILQNLEAQNTNNATSPDVHTLAQTLCGNINNPTTLAQVRDAIGSTLINPNAEEASEFDALLPFAEEPKSRQKGTSNRIQLGRLPGDLPQKVATIQANVQKINEKVGDPPDNYKQFDPSTWVTIAADGMNVRTAHDNGAGWLPSGNVKATFNTYDKKVRDVMSRDAVKTAIATKKYTESEALFHTIIRQLQQPAERQYYAWAAHGGDASPYIEISVPGNKNGRVVYDFETNRFYYTIHYNWHKGYNPFFLIV